MNTRSRWLREHEAGAVVAVERPRPGIGLVEAGEDVEEGVLTAPLGPMSAVIDPRWSSKLSILTAIRPPKRRLTLSARRMGIGLGRARFLGHRLEPLDRDPGERRAGTHRASKHELTPIAEHALRRCLARLSRVLA
jgi:hypothetical protein